MKKIIGSLVSLLISLCFFISCGDKDKNELNVNVPNTPDTTKTTVTPDTTGNRLSIVGDWVEEIPPMEPFILAKLMVYLSIVNSNSSFQMSVVEADQVNNDTLYKHTGTWQLGKNNLRSEDSLYLFGKECHIIDTTANPDTLKQLPQSVAEQTIVLDTSGTGSDIWKINLSNLTPFMSSLLPPLVLTFASSMELVFERIEKVVIRD